jgi:anti-anti-sigma factor
MPEIRARQKEGVIILDLAGRIDVDSAHLVEIVGQCVRDGYLDLLLNLEEVDFIDYLGVSAIVLAYKEVTNANGRMKFANVPTHLKNVFSVSGLDRVIEIFITEDLAVNSFQEDKVIENIKRMQLRRRFKRLPIDIKVELKSKYDKSLQPLKLDIINLSAIGCYIFGSHHFKLGDDLAIKMKLPPKDQEMELEAKVVWLPDKQVQPHIYPGMGVEFTNIPTDIQQKIIEFIDRNLSFLSQDS